MSVHDVLSCRLDTMSGAVVIKRSRVPVDTLFAYLSIEEFLEQFPTITRSEAEAVLAAALNELKNHFPHRTS
ncbi:DUF433 domain-containing protein [Mesorhizobium sp. IMUNJ 23232]|uniref:DUF433 domain-containing protein n=1 Tax=Mesorhizobium sp. IMUNJ 23232 TaxID=3376064 RepID=UPI00378875F5